MNYNSYNSYETKTYNYTPDSIYMVCGENTELCNVCTNEVYSPVVNGKVHDPYNGKVFCPFGMGDSFNQNTLFDQYSINTQKINNNVNYQTSTWGKVPQLDPRPLAKIGLEWRTS